MNNKKVLMQQSMRWFGPADPVSLSDIRQAGCEGVVSALHHIPNGDVWPIAEIKQRQKLISDQCLVWNVVESLPVHEDIKTQAKGFERYIEQYKQSLDNLAQCGISIVTYNFMPLLDWTRSDLSFELDNGAKALKFEVAAVTAYDLYILKRPQAEASYTAQQVSDAADYFSAMNEQDKQRLTRNIIAGLPGSEESFTSEGFLTKITGYAAVNHQRLQQNLVFFLQQICPLADSLKIKMVIHPDDTPYTMFGLPRVVSTAADLTELFSKVPNISNGLCFCAGSFSIRADNDLPKMIEQFGERIFFIHLRNTQRQANGDFYESEHLNGSIDMFNVVSAIHKISNQYQRAIAMRPDHGHQMLGDLNKLTNPGYSAIGRVKGLAELRGLELGIARSSIN